MSVSCQIEKSKETHNNSWFRLNIVLKRRAFLSIVIFTLASYLCIFKVPVGNLVYGERKGPIDCTSRNYSRQGKTFGTQDSAPLKPQCENLLFNLTNGAWVMHKEYNQSVIQEIETTISLVRKSLSFPKVYWRKDGKCGAKVTLPGGKTASMCDHTSSKPCCSNKLSGVCSKADSMACFCPDCLDMRKYIHGEVAKWKPNDNRCRMIHYKPHEACAVLNANTIRRKFYFVGDSLIRNTFLGLMISLSGRTEDGAMKGCTTKKSKNLCRGNLQFMLYDCLVETAQSTDDVSNTSLCNGGHRNFDVEFKPYFSSKYSNEFYSLVQSVLHQNETYLAVGIGVLDHCDVNKVINQFLNPALMLLKQEKAKWPKITWVLPLKAGVISPWKYWGLCNVEDGLNSFSARMRNFLDINEIKTFDFRKLTTFVYSYDGTHCGMGVNIMKAQIWLNYMATVL
uniref:Uncharacterized LOC100185235 n=2 Tax=Ciona intestinalis TaxID=7719 RepID=F6YT96_CIOIN|nr:uncharacterized protein LOC100185235 isoform X1 [Ciona intestinalis]|eukprot:XP_002125642.1 uncharacterized protein LOC100185235 isoform X1 [Ciona intestinalis]